MVVVVVVCWDSDERSFFFFFFLPTNEMRRRKCNFLFKRGKKKKKHTPRKINNSFTLWWSLVVCRKIGTDVVRSISYSAHIFRYARARYAHRTCGWWSPPVRFSYLVSFLASFFVWIFSFVFFFSTCCCYWTISYLRTDNKNQIFR